METLTSSQKKAIDAGLASLDKNKRIPHDEVMKETRKRFPQLSTRHQ